MSQLKTLIALFTAGACAGPVEGAGATYLSCGPQSERSAAICAQMRGVIEAAVPGALLEERPVSDTPPASARAVRLWIDALRESHISAHLEWHIPGKGWTRGETLSMDVMDARLSDAMLAGFLGSLWQRSGIED